MVESCTAKLKCVSVLITETSETVTLQAVTAGKDNEEWSKWTPSGKFEKTITNPALFGFYVPGREYYATTTPVEA